MTGPYPAPMPGWAVALIAYVLFVVLVFWVGGRLAAKRGRR